VRSNRSQELGSKKTFQVYCPGWGATKIAGGYETNEYQPDEDNWCDERQA